MDEGIDVGAMGASDGVGSEAPGNAEYLNLSASTAPANNVGTGVGLISSTPACLEASQLVPAERAVRVKAHHLVCRSEELAAASAWRPNPISS